MDEFAEKDRYAGTDAEVLDYQSMSGLAVAALFLGLASPLALIHIVLGIVPLLGTLAGIIALRRIDQSDSILVGRKVALTGLALSVYFGVAAPARLISRDYWLTERAERFSQAWLDLLAQGEKLKAHQLTKPALQRQPLNESLEIAYASPEAKQALDGFLGIPAVQALLEWGPGAQRQLLDSSIRVFAISPDSHTGPDLVTLTYQISSPSQSPQRESFRLQMRLLRIEVDGTEQWQLQRADAVE